jgi:hypothetical protein
MPASSELHEAIAALETRRNALGAEISRRAERITALESQVDGATAAATFATTRKLPPLIFGVFGIVGVYASTLLLWAGAFILGIGMLVACALMFMLTRRFETDDIIHIGPDGLRLPGEEDPLSWRVIEDVTLATTPLREGLTLKIKRDGVWKRTFIGMPHDEHGLVDALEEWSRYQRRLP